MRTGRHARRSCSSARARSSAATTAGRCVASACRPCACGAKHQLLDALLLCASCIKRMHLLVRVPEGSTIERPSAFKDQQQSVA